MEMQDESIEPLRFVTRSVYWSSVSSCVLRPDDGDFAVQRSVRTTSALDMAKPWKSLAS